MKKKFCSKIKFCFILILLIIFLFQNQYILAYTGEDAETIAKYPGADISSCTFHLTTYGGSKTSTGLTPANDFTYNSTMGWYEYEYNGRSYVVIAGAHRSLIRSSDDSSGHGYYRSWIHYFNYYDTIQFKLDGSVYDGIILDCCGASMKVAEGASQILDIYCYDNSTITGTGGKMAELDGSTVEVTDTGQWSSSAGTSSSSTLGEFVLKCFAKIFVLLGDFVQNLIDRTGTDATSYDSITYSMTDIQADSDLNDDINVVAGNDLKAEDEDLDEGIVKEASISVDWASSSTEIPVIPIEMYSSSIEKVQLYDIDFLSSSNTNSNGFWSTISSAVRVMTRIVLYIAAIALITSIIWRAILLVLASYRDDPGSAERSKHIINSIFKTVLYMVGVYVIIFIMIYLYKYILSLIIGDNDTSYIIRLNVENIYTFNTNITGYIRYRVLTENATACFGYAFLYMIIAFMNGIYFLLMILRMIILALLTIIAPITSLSAMKEDKVQVGFSLTNMFNFNVWLKLYTWFTWWPMVVIILIRAMLMIA